MMTSIQPATQPQPTFTTLRAGSSTESTSFDKLLRAWKNLQVSYYGGKYSIERLLALEEYARKTKLLRAICVCIGTPIPTAALVVIQESIPLQDPTKGWRENYGFWIRAAILAMLMACVVVGQMRYFIDGITLSWSRELLFSVCTAAVFTVIAAFVSAHLLFPVPFFVLTLAPLFYTSYIVVFRILAGGRIFQHILASRVEFFRYIKFLVAENVVACTYPAYEALFRLAQGTHCQLPVIFLLPITKMALKNMMLQCAVQMEDMTPEAVIFTVDFFNAVYVSSCMQSATSLVSVVAIIATDLPQTAFMLYGLHQRTTSTRQRLRQVIGGSRNDNLLDAPCYLCQDPERFDRQTRMGIRIYSCLPHLLSTEKKALLDKLDQVPQTRDCRAPKASNCVRHWLWLSYRVEAIHPAVNDSEPATKTLASPMRIPGARKNSESFPTRRLALGESLETLFSLECIVVTAYLEAVTPIFYCCYVLVMVHLPSSQYHMELTGITSDNAGSKVQSLFVFGLFQIASFVVLALVIKRNCGIHALQHLAFVFETQTSLVQGKLMGWMVITLCFRVVHFGVDFTFQFCNLMN
ncbi:hypothetical protein PC116_g14716 [Phytophthora cactorum]|uniref:Uncharacterized protein n=1 Tax=Phytophthora cactorum TaxID=29920 RepID=A0A8T1G130_9STRA|nr:hypothetical protein PC112_g10905 [Phytophthora cactorum]KAG2825023.1 hypothetical protein PC111_g9566 [Phytophthora cactorum]KAG2942475.1 hypothetical protein PC117_g9758 [Phytophthora cactorum]KAG2981314.1 hypothetical protein PC118_g10679 [Phytophthora cactorum]KAG3006334.1 hypothetical protein PC119_g15005 [Phytophthora cactorum]